MILSEALKIAEETCAKDYPSKKAVRAIDDGDNWIFLFGSVPVENFDYEWTFRKEDFPAELRELFDVQTGTDITVTVAKISGVCKITPATDYMHLEIGSAKPYVDLEGANDLQ